MEDLRQVIGIADRERQIELLSGYMTEADAKAMADKYEYLEFHGGNMEDEFMTIISISAYDVYQPFCDHGWLVAGHPIPMPGDWAVCARYVLDKLNDKGEWETVGEEDDHLRGGILGDLIKTYNVEL